MLFRRLTIGIGIGNDIGIARGTLPDSPPEALVTGLGDNGVNLVARFRIDPPRRREAVDALDGAVEAVKLALGKAGVDLPYPTSRVLFRDLAETTEGDRARQRGVWATDRRDSPCHLGGRHETAHERSRGDNAKPERAPRPDAP